MNVIDIILLALLILATIQGLRKGFISQIISIISIIVGLWASCKFATITGEYISQWIEGSEQMIRIISFALILIVVVIVFTLLGKSLEAILKFAMLGWLNKLLGAIFSILKGLLILGIIASFIDATLTSFNIVRPGIIAESQLYDIISKFGNSIFPYIRNFFS